MRVTSVGGLDTIRGCRHPDIFTQFLKFTKFPPRGKHWSARRPTSQAHLGLKLSTIQLTIYNTAVASTSACHSLCCLCLDVWMPTWDCAEQWKVYEVTQYVIVSLGSLLWFPLGGARDNFVTNGDLALSLCCVTTLKCHLPSCHPASPTPALSPNIFMLNSTALYEPSQSLKFYNHGEGPSPGWNRLLLLSHLRIYQDTMLNRV